jgi:hypothetical protein
MCDRKSSVTCVSSIRYEWPRWKANPGWARTKKQASLETRSPGLLPARLSAAVADGVGTHVMESNAQE